MYVLQQLINGLSQGSIYALMASASSGSSPLPTAKWS